MSRPLRYLVVAAAALLAGPALWRLADAGRTNEYAGHAIFVPLFCVLAAWADRDRLRAAAGPGHPGGLLVLAAGVALLGTGYAWSSQVLQGLALAVVAAGAVLWLYGGACLRAAAFPVLFLGLMAPLPKAVVAAITLKLQMFAAGFAAGALRMIDIPVYQTGVFLELPTMLLEVAEVCNGLRFLLAILVLTAAFGHVVLPTWRRQVILVAAAVPIAVVANAIRVAVIGIGVTYVGPEAATGELHNWIGKGVWALTLIPLALLTLGLATLPRGRRQAAAAGPLPAGEAETA